jgi:hypothetical protein
MRFAFVSLLTIVPAAVGIAAARADRSPVVAEDRPAGRIAYISERNGKRQVFVDEHALTPADHDAYVGDAYKGTLVIVEVFGDAEQLATIDLATGARTPVGPRAHQVRNPAFSPSGELYYESDLHGFSDVYRGDTRLTDAPEGSFEPHVGSRVVFTSSRDGDAEVYALEGSRAVRLTTSPGDDFSPRVAGDRIAFLSARDGEDHVYTMRLDGSEQRRFTRGPGTERDIAWSPDGRHLAYTKKKRVWVDDRPLADGDSPAWSPDGRHIAFVSDRDGDPEIYVMRADGTNQKRITRARGADWRPVWITGVDP